jgi:epoxide hydrolase-like predicted phosphatase
VPDRRGLLVDWGGVLTTSVFASFTAFCADEGLAADRVAQAFRHDPEGRRLLGELETGVLAEEDFERPFGALLGLAEDRAPGLVDRLFQTMRPEPGMLEAVRRARAAGIRTGLISNSWGHERYDHAVLGELFDAVVISGREGIRKPHPRMYALGAERLGLSPAACIYVDDLAGNLKPARAMGMATLHHTDTGATAAALERLLGVPLGGAAAGAAATAGPSSRLP